MLNATCPFLQSGPFQGIRDDFFIRAWQGVCRCRIGSVHGLHRLILVLEILPADRALSLVQQVEEQLRTADVVAALEL